MENELFDYYELSKEKYQCLFCGRCFLIVCDVQVLADHLQKSHHNKFEGVEFANSHSLNEGGFISTYKSSITNIISIHTRNKGVKYQCNECSYQAKRCRLNDHKRSVHYGIKYSCDECDYEASRKDNLIRHKRASHDGEKYQCDECNYEAAHQSTLKNHKSSKHNGIKYSCDECDYKASRKVYLRNHKRSLHEGIIKYPCDMKM